MAVHVLAVLGYKQGEHVTSSLLAKSVNTNPVMVRRLLLALQRAQLVETRKGTGVGSRLSRSPARISLDEVFRAVEEEDPFIMPRNKPNRACPVGNCIQIAISEVFGSARKALEQDLSKTTLADVLNTVESCCSRQTSVEMVNK
jgi:Rrf2 family protein